MYDAPYYRRSQKLEGKIALITGGDSGIGRSVAVLFAREGADVAISFLIENTDAKVTQAAVDKEGRRCLLLPGDVSRFEHCRNIVEQVVQTFGGLDILVNNAAFQYHAQSLEELSPEHFDITLKTNLYGYFYMAREAAKHMRSGAAIINTGSISGIDGSKDLLDYSMTKGGNPVVEALRQKRRLSPIRTLDEAPHDRPPNSRGESYPTRPFHTARVKLDC